MRLFKILLVCALIAGVGPAFAAPNTSSTGEKCAESASGVKHTINGKQYTCDKCVFLVCQPSGNQIVCGNKTEWTNCVEAAGSGSGSGLNRAPGADRMAPPKNTPKPGQPAGTNKNQ